MVQIVSVDFLREFSVNFELKGIFSSSTRYAARRDYPNWKYHFISNAQIPGRRALRAQLGMGAIKIDIDFSFGQSTNESSVARMQEYGMRLQSMECIFIIKRTNS